MRLQASYIWTRLILVLSICTIALGCAPPRVPTSTQVIDSAEAGPNETSIPPTPAASAESRAIRLINPGFEDRAADGKPAGWDLTGTIEAVTLDDRGHSGEYRLTHKGAEAYQVAASQTVPGLANQWYTLHAWVRSSGGQNSVYIALQCGGAETRVFVPSTSPGYRWLHLVVSNQVTDSQCVISLVSDGNPGTWASFDDIELVPGRATLSILGADISSLKKSEDLGGIYRETDGSPTDALQILKNHGLNYARLRVWVDPADGYHNKERILEMAQRLNGLDIKLLVDFHYSDNWADPGKQFKPAAWKEYDFEQLKQAVYDHTFDVCNSLMVQATPPDMVQLGNEINSGMLWPDGHTWDPPNWEKLAQLLTAGYDAVKACSPDTLVMLHIAEGGDNDLARWWFDNITRRDVPFDLIGISYYPYWHGSLMELQGNLNDITARYDRNVIVVETAYAYTNRDDDNYANIVDDRLANPNYSLTPEGQRAFLRDLMAVVRAVDQGRGLGIFYWDATWTAVQGNGWDNSDPSTGNAWENQALFDFNGEVLPALDEYLNP